MKQTSKRRIELIKGLQWLFCETKWKEFFFPQQEKKKSKWRKKTNTTNKLDADNKKTNGIGERKSFCSFSACGEGTENKLYNKREETLFLPTIRKNEQSWDGFRFNIVKLMKWDFVLFLRLLLLLLTSSGSVGEKENLANLKENFLSTSVPQRWQRLAKFVTFVGLANKLDAKNLLISVSRFFLPPFKQRFVGENCRIELKFVSG